MVGGGAWFRDKCYRVAPVTTARLLHWATRSMRERMPTGTGWRPTRGTGLEPDAGAQGSSQGPAAWRLPEALVDADFGGSHNEAVQGCASVSGGYNNFAQGVFDDVGCASVSGGANNRATGPESSVSGGKDNSAEGQYNSISGGEENIAGPPNDIRASSILGGLQQTTTANFETIPALP